MQTSQFAVKQCVFDYSSSGQRVTYILYVHTITSQKQKLNFKWLCELIPEIAYSEEV